jgi:succinylarginine dihydrolase
MRAYEVNFDGLVGPTHNYAGMSYGNIASLANERMVSNPRQAALQGLEKMHFLARLGVRQAVLPPHERPYMPLLRQLGFSGTDAQILQTVQKEHPQLLLAALSSASMWAANAATVSPSADCANGRLHITPANMNYHLHRTIEAGMTERMLRAIFSDPAHFCVHDALPSNRFFSDEGAANHLRFCNQYGDRGVELFVYGKQAVGEMRNERPARYPARQTLEASQAIARGHQLDPSRLLFVQQNPAAIDAGVFHNDVISVSNQNLFLYHEQAFVNTSEVVEAIQNKMAGTLIAIKVTSAALSLEEAVSSYLFNSQIVTLKEGRMVMIAPTECQEMENARAFCQSLEGGIIDRIYYMNLRESMRNGGGPACLRLRVVLTEKELAAVKPHLFLTDQLYETLKDWINRHYRDRLEQADLADPKLLQESHEALNELEQILHLGKIYEF